MTLITIAQDVADEIRITRPTAMIPNTDPDAQNLLRLANKVGTDLMEKVAWQALRKETAFTSIAGETQTGILASDFDRFVDETFWNRSTPRLMNGPVTPVRWQSAKASSSTTDYPIFTRRGGAILVNPVLSAGDALAFEYVSNEWCQSSGSVGQTAWAADTDTGVIDEELMTLGVIFEYMLAQGLPQTPVAAEQYADKINLLSKNERNGTPILSAGDVFAGRRHTTGEPQTFEALA